MPEVTLQDVMAAIGGLAVEVQGVKDRLGSLETKVGSLETKVGSLATGQAALAEKIDAVDAGLKIKIEETRVDLKADIAAAQAGNVLLFNAQRADFHALAKRVGPSAGTEG